MPENHPYVEFRDGAYVVRGLKAQLSQIIMEWQEGQSPENIAQDFAYLTRGQVYGAIAYYLDHQQALDEHFAQRHLEEEAIIAEAHAKDPEWHQELLRRFDALQSRKKASAS